VDIKAQYNVKQFHDRDVGVIVNLSGRMPNPKIDFSSNIGYELSQSDLLSYLIIGRPGFDFGANGQATQTLASFLAPTISAVAADRLRQNLGSAFSSFTLELGAANPAQQNAGLFNSTALSQYLSTATIGAQKQVTSNLYLGLSTPLCQLQFAGRPVVGATLAYQFTPKFSLQGGYDPASNTRGACNSAGSQLIIGTVPTPPNWSLSLRQVLKF
jgi:hypothetical protein